MIQVKSYGGLPGWIIHKYLSRYFMKGWLYVQQALRQRETYEYVHRFIALKEAPVFAMVEIETIDRCNGTCAFCPANVKSETRPFRKMDEATFEKIVRELHEMDYSGEVLLEVNNEPLIDVRLAQFAKQLKEHVPKCKKGIITNGSLLTVKKIEELKDVLDKVVINNYSTRYRLNDNVAKIYRYIKANESRFCHMEIEIRRRYVGEVLTNRAGTAPNNTSGVCNITMPCLYPFVGITVFPNGVVGLCSNDCLEQTDFGNINDQTMLDIWNGSAMREMRRKIARGRKNYAFCKDCDVIGIGTREQIARGGGR